MARKKRKRTEKKSSQRKTPPKPTTSPSATSHPFIHARTRLSTLPIAKKKTVQKRGSSSSLVQKPFSQVFFRQKACIPTDRQIYKQTGKLSKEGKSYIRHKRETTPKHYRMFWIGSSCKKQPVQPSERNVN